MTSNSEAERAHNRICSIRYDVENFLTPFLETASKKLTVIANERCGSWYAHPFFTKQQTKNKKPISCYFKSSDGHVGTWDLSLKRLNLNVINIVVKSGSGCLILDASVRKALPDSLSRTIPIWCAVFNRIVLKYREEASKKSELSSLEYWDTDLHTPKWLISEEEHETISNLLDDRVEALYQSGAIVNPAKLIESLTKPLRPYWMTPERMELSQEMNEFDERYFSLVCVSCSTPVKDLTSEVGFDYVPGAADDHESWVRNLTPRLFWHHIEELSRAHPDCLLSVMDDIAAKTRDSAASGDDPHDVVTFDRIGETGGILSIGTRRAGRPPECWEHFDAVLNVTTLEYDDMKNVPLLDKGKYYMQLPVEEGKRDRNELERWMAVGIAFVIHHSNNKRRILIHCAQGMDRSVAVAIACIVLLCDLKDPAISFRPEVAGLTQAHLYHYAFGEEINDESSLYLNSGLSDRMVQALLGRPGRDLILRWLRHVFNLEENVVLATKETQRVALHLIQQHREKASPTRSTMQKLNRFFMSAQYQ